MSTKCAATTKSGSPCKRNAVDGTDYCKQHASAGASVKAAAETVTATAKTEAEKVEAALGQIKDRVEEIKSDSEKFSPANFSPEKLFAWIKENIGNFNSPVINEISDKLTSATADDFRNPDTWKEIWVIVSAAIQEEMGQAMSKAEEVVSPAISKAQEQLDGLPTLGEAKQQINENATVKGAIDFVEKLPGYKEGKELISQVPGSSTISKLTDAIDTTSPKDFLDPKTWEGFWTVINHSLSDEINTLRGVEVEEEIIVEEK